MSEAHVEPTVPDPGFRQEAPAPVTEPVAPPPAAPVEPPPPPGESRDPVEPPPPTEPPPEPAVREPAAGFLTERPKPGETPAEAVPPEPAAEGTVPAEEIKYEFTPPDGFTWDPERAAPLTQWLGEHRIPADRAQELLDMHFREMQEFADRTVAEQWRAFEDSRTTKRNEAMADPAYGDNDPQKFRANADTGQRMIDFFMPDEAERGELYRRLNASGMSDDLYLGKMLLNAARRLAEPAPPPPNPTPLPSREAAGRAPRGQGRGSLYVYPRGRQNG